MENLYSITYPKPEQKAAVYIFRKAAELKKVRTIAKISAVTRYKLYINDILAAVGPSKGSDKTRYYDEVDLSQFIKEGYNEIKAEVLYIPQDSLRLNSVISGIKPEFFMYTSQFRTDSSWRCRECKEIEIQDNKVSPIAAVNEHIKEASEQEVQAEKCQRIILNDEYEYGQLNGKLEKSIIPVMKIGEKKNILSEYTIPPYTAKTIILDVGVLQCAYVGMEANGKGKVSILYSECYSKKENGEIIKGMRDDESGELEGDSDIIECNLNTVYNSFWFKTFRFIKVEIKTEEAPLTIKKLYTMETTYPLKIEADFKCSSKEYNKMWDISLRTLLNCMHETYEDCPYYEQMQYTMDTMLEMLYTYPLSQDIRLGKKAVLQFGESVLPNGLIQSRYPSVMKQIIPGFCLYYIMLLEDYCIYTSDIETVKKVRYAITGILDWFERHLDENGLVGCTGYWSYVDWVDGWKSGVPIGGDKNGLSVYSMMYSKALECASNIMNVLGKKSEADEYMKQHERINVLINMFCFDSNVQLYKNGANIEEYSEHAQIWAVLCGAAGENGKKLIENALKRNIKRCSFSMRYFLLRALEKTEMYNLADGVYDAWRSLMNCNCTTWPEIPDNARSECHAWSAVMLYEFTHCILGVNVNMDHVEIKPFTQSVDFAEGTVCTKFGKIKIEWKKIDESLKVRIFANIDTMKKIKKNSEYEFITADI